MIIKQPDENIEITVLDQPGAGGAHHEYAIDTIGHLPAEHYEPMARQYISFQNGPILEHGVNGVTVEALLEIAKHRLECFQAGPFACEPNAIALAGVQDALAALYKRTADRKKRGVEGKSEL